MGQERKQSIDLAPIVVFTYNRPRHTKQTIESLRKNELAADSRLIIFSDSAKNSESISAVAETREYLKTINGFKSITIYEREKNYGLANNIVDGVTKVISEFGKIIVLEDDLITAPYFLQYVNAALVLYEKEEKIISISSYIYPLKDQLPETFFIKGADCLGWATWKRGWNLFEKDAKILLSALEDRNLQREFDFDGSYPYMRMLRRQSRGRIGSWAIRWYASAFLKDKLTLYPSRSLIFHNGGDGSGTNVGVDSFFDVSLSPTPIKVGGIEISEDTRARRLMADFFRTGRDPIWRRAIRKLKRIIIRQYRRTIKGLS